MQCFRGVNGKRSEIKNLWNLSENSFSSKLKVFPLKRATRGMRRMKKEFDESKVLVNSISRVF